MLRHSPSVRASFPRSGSLARLALVAGAVLALITARVAFGKPEFDWPDWDALKAKYPDAGAVFLLDETVSELGRQGDEFGRRVDVHQVIAIIDPQQAAGWLDWEIPNSEYHSLSRIEARTWLSPNQSHRVEKKDFHDVSMFPDEVLYSDIRGKRFAFPAIAPRTVIDVSYEYTSPSIYSYDQHLFAHHIPTLVSRVSFVVPRAFLAEEFDQAVRVSGLTRTTPMVQVLPRPEGEVKQFTWEMRDVEAIVQETQMPPLSDLAPLIRLAPRAPTRTGWSWAWVGRHYYDELLMPQLKGTPQIRELATRLTAGFATPIDKVRALYGYVQTDVRYVAIELGIGGYQPHPAQRVLGLRYGDCKDKSTLLLSLLHEIGIEGFAALVRTRDQGAVDTALVNIGQFNHMIVWLPIGESGWWLDPTAEYATADYLPAADQGIMALVVGPSVSRFLATPVLDPERSITDRRVLAAMDEEGGLSGTLEIRVGGEPGMDYRGAFRTRGAPGREQLIDRILTRELSGARLKEFRITGLESVEKPLVLAIDFAWPRCATVAGDAIVLPGDFLSPPGWAEPLRRTGRRNPVLFDGLEQRRDRIRILPPAGWTFDLPAGVAEQGSCFSFFRDASNDSGAVRIERTAALERLAISRPNFDLARSELARGETAYSEPIRFRRAR